MKTRMMLLAAAAIGLMSSGLAQAATSGFSTANVNMRSGPSTEYPAVELVPEGAPVRIHGCLANQSWCDVTWEGNRGWVSNNYLQVDERGRRVAIPRQPESRYDANQYWEQNYRGRSFYRERDRWMRYDRDRRGSY